MSTAAPDVGALIFDVFGTVVDWRSSLIAEADAFGRERGIVLDWASLVDDWRAAYQPSMDRVRRGEGWIKLDRLHEDSLRHLLAARDVRLSEPDVHRLVTGWHRLKPWPDSVAGLARLKKRYTIGTLSNGNVSLLAHLAKSAGLPWDVILSAELFHAYKPDPKTYLGAAELLSEPPERVMLVAAHNYDLKAARACGLKTGFVARPSEYGPRQAQDLSALENWDVIAADFMDLAAKLGV